MNRPSWAYSVDIAGLHATCEGNYARLLRLFPDYETANHREFQLRPGHRVRIDVMQRCRYTTIMTVHQTGDGPAPWLTALRFELRVYHDVRMVEVASFQSSGGVRARYEYPNPGMHSRDEKAQQNRFFKEWLTHCMEQGYSADRLPTPAPASADVP